MTCMRFFLADDRSVSLEDDEKLRSSFLVF
jgi:hypothetical protein